MGGIEGHWHPLMRPSQAELQAIPAISGIEGHWNPLLRPSRAELNSVRQSQPQPTAATLKKAPSFSSVATLTSVDTKDHSVDRSSINELHAELVSNVADHHVQMIDEEINSNSSSRDSAKLAPTDPTVIEVISHSLSEEKSPEFTEAVTSFTPDIETPQLSSDLNTQPELNKPDLSNATFSSGLQIEAVDTNSHSEKVSALQSEKESISDIDTRDNSISTINHDPSATISKVIEQKSDHLAQDIQIVSNRDLNTSDVTDQNAFTSTSGQKVQVPTVSSSEKHVKHLSAEENEDQDASCKEIPSIKIGPHSADTEEPVPVAVQSIGMPSYNHLSLLY